jgi:hypothetical protein
VIEKADESFFGMELLVECNMLKSEKFQELRNDALRFSSIFITALKTSTKKTTETQP